jgi:hypothetical protein
MKLKALLLSAILLAPQAVFSQQITVYGECNAYRVVEEYVPGHYTRFGAYISGYVRRTRVRVPCEPEPYFVPYRPYPRYYDECIERRGIVGGTLGLLFGC